MKKRFLNEILRLRKLAGIKSEMELGLEPDQLEEDDYDMGTPSGDTDAMNIAEDGSNVVSDDEVVRRTIEGFDLKFVPEAYRNAYTTKKDRPSPALARRINAWIEKNFPYSLIRVAFEGVYRTVNFYRQNTK